MEVQCKSCKKTYRIDETKIKTTKVTVRCPKCQGLITVEKPFEATLPKDDENIKRISEEQRSSQEINGEQRVIDAPEGQNISGNMDLGQKKSMGEISIDILKALAWINLIGGIIAAIIILSTMGWVEMVKMEASGFFKTYTETNPIAIYTGFAILAEAIFGWALLLVICSMAENLIKIRENTFTLLPGKGQQPQQENKEGPEIMEQTQIQENKEDPETMEQTQITEDKEGPEASEPMQIVYHQKLRKAMQELAKDLKEKGSRKEL